MACQMNDALFEQQSITFASPNVEYKATGRKLLFDGFYKILGSDDKDKLLPLLKEGEAIDIKSINAAQHFTEPPARYNEASIIKKLEAEGIGRPSTYAPTISTLTVRTYINVEKKQLIPTEMAFTVTELLEKNFKEIVDASFTANMEEVLDEIAEGKKDWQKTLQDFYFPFMKEIEEGKENIVSTKLAQPTGKSCPKCGSELLLRSGRYGNFIACSGFPKCKYTEQVEGEEKAETSSEGTSEEKCEKCGSDMVVKNGRNGQFLACSAYPKCKNTKTLEATAAKVSEVPCPDCGGKLLFRQSRRGAFWGCESYPTCKFISKFEPSTLRCAEDGCGGVLAARVYRNKDIYECIKCKNKTPRESEEQA
jgi:DNA topoisomerase-1